MSIDIFLGQIDGREAALLRDGKRIEDLLIDTDAPRPGSIYRAIADRPVKGQGGMFCKTPDGSVFLKQVKGLSPGQPLLVQVTGYAEEGKAIPVTTRLLFKSRYAIVTPDAPGLNVSRAIRDEARRDELLEIAHEVMDGAEMGLILRSACVDAEDHAIAADIAEMRDVAAQILSDDSRSAELLLEGDGPHAIAWRDWPEGNVIQGEDVLSDPTLLDDVAHALRTEVSLGGGAYAYVEPTRALVAVDVNTGADTSPAAGLKANIALARELPRLLRLRGLAGQVVIDFAPMAKKDRRQLEGALQKALRADSIETNLIGWTPLGHLELSRHRARARLDWRPA
ncbi:ribonuclease E/G [Mesobacterium pallidum]|uniref:ribonuclease E/G n=1 Tax=Mesobacterium pallidum TaxID=2872037 RepID=UPI001EE2E51C|nr:ribonuclease E/G [Mesobacterium pallidum]